MKPPRAGASCSASAAVPPTSSVKPARRSPSITSTGSATSRAPKRLRCRVSRAAAGVYGPTPCSTEWLESRERWLVNDLLGLCCLGRLLAALGRLRAELLREPLHAAFRVDQLLPSGEERMTVRADFEVELRLGGAGLPRRAARAARLDVVILRMDAFLHGELLGV